MKQVYLNAEKKEKVNYILFVQKANSEMLFQILPGANRRTSVCETLAGQKDGARGDGEGLRYKGGIGSGKTYQKGNSGNQAWNRYLHIVWTWVVGKNVVLVCCLARGAEGLAIVQRECQMEGQPRSSLPETEEPALTQRKLSSSNVLEHAKFCCPFPCPTRERGGGCEKSRESAKGFCGVAGGRMGEWMKPWRKET